MGKDRIDASIGLAFSLAIFEQYRNSGLLQAELQKVPGYQGRCKGYLHLIEGKVISCYLEDRIGQRHPTDKSVLIQLDSRRGPFEWSLTPAPPPPPVIAKRNVPHPAQHAPVPRQIAVLDINRLEGWTSRHKKMLLLVYEAIDGQRSITDIQAEVPLPPEVVEEGLRILLTLKVIVISS